MAEVSDSVLSYSSRSWFRRKPPRILTFVPGRTIFSGYLEELTLQIKKTQFFRCMLKPNGAPVFVIGEWPWKRHHENQLKHQAVSNNFVCFMMSLVFTFEKVSGRCKKLKESPCWTTDMRKKRTFSETIWRILMWIHFPLPSSFLGSFSSPNRFEKLFKTQKTSFF